MLNMDNAEHAKLSDNAVKNVPEVVKSLFSDVFGKKLGLLWVKVGQAFKSVNSELLTKDSMLKVGESVLRFLARNRKLAIMSVDEMCKYVYKGSLKAFKNILNALKTYEFVNDDLNDSNELNDLNVFNDHLNDDKLIEHIINADCDDNISDCLKYMHSYFADVVFDLEEEDFSTYEDCDTYKTMDITFDERKDEKPDYKQKMESLWNWVRQTVQNNNPLDWSQHFKETVVEYNDNENVVYFKVDGAWSASIVEEYYGNWLDKLVKHYFGYNWASVVTSRL
jgi:hypothetical protein